MRIGIALCFLLAALAGFWVWQDMGLVEPPGMTLRENAGKAPSDWFWRQRAYPFEDIDHEAFLKARLQFEHLKAEPRKRRTRWQDLGPTLVGGRMTDVEYLPNGAVLAGAATGGIYKSMDRGQTWTSIFDDAFSLSIGDLAYAPSNPDIIYAGTGEANGGGGSSTYAGVGVYRSDDGGESWARAGLENSRFIGRIVVHPQNPDWVYVAAMGELYGRNEERGVYRSKDGGHTWQRLLFLGSDTGAIDIVLDPNRPNRVFAATWQRQRSSTNIDYGGPQSGIYFSDDDGDTWQELTQGLPSGPNRGRIGLAIAASNPHIMYAIYAHVDGHLMGVFKSVDGGQTWQRTVDEALSANYSTFGWWFGQIRVHPQDPDFVFALGLDIYFSRDGGGTWVNFTDFALENGFIQSNDDFVHVDQHGLAFDPNNVNVIVAANDGGIYFSETEILNFRRRNNFSNNQFYTCEIDPQLPSRIYGGTQDNGTWGNATSDPTKWVKYFGGDGFQVEVDPTNSNSIYLEFQFGNLFHFLNGDYIDGRAHLLDSDRANWNTPILIDPNDANIVYHASQRLFRTTSGVENFVAISGDLTNGDGGGNRVFGTITTLAVAVDNSQIIYVGTDDGNFQVTTNGGESWTNRNAGLPNRWVTGIAVHPADPKTVYATFSGFRNLDYQPHIMRSRDGGLNWEDVSANLPEAPLNDIIVNPDDPRQLFVASDFGVFSSANEGSSWSLLGSGLPSVIVLDIDLHAPSKTLVAATFGRGMYRLDLAEALADEVGKGTQMPHRYHLSELRGQLKGETYIGVVNPRENQVDLELFGFASDGELLEKSPTPMAFTAHEKRMFNLVEAFPQKSAEIAWVQIGSSEPVHAFAEIGDDEARGAYLAEPITPGTVFLPHVAKDTAQFQTFLSSVNPHSASISHVIRNGRGGDAQPVHEHLTIYSQMNRDIRDYFGQSLQAIAFAQLEAPLRGAASMEFFHRLPQRRQIAALGLNQNKGNTLRFLHVASDTVNFWTGMVYINIGSEPARAEEHYFSADGVVLDVRVREDLLPEEKMTLLFDQNNAQAIPKETAWIEVRADQNLIGYDLFGASSVSSNDFFAGIQGAFQAHTHLVYPHFQAGEFQWLGLVAVNTGSEVASIRLDVHAADGRLLETKTVDGVPAKGKRTFLVGEFFESDAARNEGAWIMLNGDMPVWNGFLLWGDRGGPTRTNMAGIVARPFTD